MITFNLDIRQFAEDVIVDCEGPELLRAFYKAISSVSVLDPTCGSGAFLFAALNILEPLYDACLDRMQGFIDDLDNSGKHYRPEKFSDFKVILKSVDEHPNRQFFILKSIVVNNLYGVDIMEEAVEICKLRLFLKLVAQVDKVKQLEPLPDIDFNIRSGNTLVGYVSVDEIRKAAEVDASGRQTQILLESTKDEIGRIEEDAGLVEKAFNRFHEMQTHHQMDVTDFRDAKEELRNRLKKLSSQLDQYLAKEYGVDPRKKKYFELWRNSHQPFHWLIEFYSIINQGGFDVIIGNPPYVEYKNVNSTYKVINFKSLPCKELYAYVIERSFSLLNILKRIGLIVPISIFGVDRFGSIQNITLKSLEHAWVSCYSNRPSQIFDGAQKRLTIMLGRINEETQANIFTTKYYRWRKGERECLLDAKLEYIKRESSFSVSKSSLEKVGSLLEEEILSKLLSDRHKLSGSISASEEYPIYYTRKFGYSLAFLDIIPEIREIATGEKRLPSELKTIQTDSIESLYGIIAALSSSTFFWFWNSISDCRNLNRRDLLSFPFSPKKIDGKIRKMLSDYGKKYVNELKNTSQTMIKSGLEIETFDYALCKKSIDDIDRLLSEIYGFNDEQLDFIVNYDIKYRLGQ